MEAKMRKPRPDAVAELAAVVGAEEAERIVAGIEKNAHELADAGVRFKEVGAETEPETTEVEAKAETEIVEPVVEEVAKETAVAPEAPAAVSPEVVTPQAFDAVFSTETLKAMAVEVAALTAAAVLEVLSESVIKSMQANSDMLKAMEKQVAHNVETMDAIAKREDERIKEQVGLLPRATLKAITSTPVAARPSQRNGETVTADTEKLSFAEIAKQTLYGNDATVN
jgi:hypothetical protein